MTAASPTLHHLTLTTGDDRVSPRSEVGADTLNALRPWLARACESDVEVPLPAGLERYTAIAIPHGSGLVMTVYGPTPDRPTPLVTFAVAQDAGGGDELWAKLAGRFGAAPGLQKPPEPWCGVVVHPALVLDGAASEWLGDFERCVAWAWITRSPHLRAVS